METKPEIIIYHNPRCSKSRECVNEFSALPYSYRIVEYLKEPFTAAGLGDLLKKLNISAEELVRKNESEYKEELRGKLLSEADFIEAMLRHPKLIQRPIVEYRNNAVIARPFKRRLK